MINGNLNFQFVLLEKENETDKTVEASILVNNAILVFYVSTYAKSISDGFL